MPSEILIISIAGVGPLPVVIDDGGRVIPDILAWLVAKKEEQRSASTLYRYALAASRFDDYWKLHEQQGVTTPPFRGFFESLVHGRDELCWKGVSIDTARRLVDSVFVFVDWFSETHEKENPNPKIEVPLSWGQRLEQYRRRFKNDLLFHLLPATQGARIKRQRRIIPYVRAGRGVASKPAKPTKKFSLDDYLLLLAHERNPRNLLLWLVLGAGGPRLSEALHLFIHDVLFDRVSDQARIVLADPTYGKIRVPGRNGMERMTRQEYLRLSFGRSPRDQLASNHIDFVGWKGMKWHDPVAKTSDIVWLHPYFGHLFWKTHQEYLSLRGATRPKHPWYFVNIKANTGEPLSESNAQGLFADACGRLNLLSPDNPHTLRHMYIDTLVNTLGMSIHEAQILARHVSPESTEVYATASLQATRRSLETLATKILALPGADKWLNPQQ